MHSPQDIWPAALAGTSTAAQRARAAFTAAVPSPAPALLVAERGLDADAIALALHDRGRRGQPFVVVDCATADHDVEQAIFGRLPRAAGGGIAAIGSSSALLKAGAGTLYLKQIVELPAAAQQRLARILRDREVHVSGRHVHVKARILAGAAPSIAADVRDGQVRADLYRRLSQVRIEVPSLRERPGDLRELATIVAADLLGGRPPSFTQAALTVLTAPAWPGNLDELRAVLAAVIRTVGDGPIRQEDVLAHLPLAGAFARLGPPVSLREARRQFERDYIASVLERHRWSMSDAARTLGIERANLYRKTRQLGILRRGAGTPVAS